MQDVFLGAIIIAKELTLVLPVLVLQRRRAYPTRFAKEVRGRAVTLKILKEALIYEGTASSKEFKAY